MTHRLWLHPKNCITHIIELVRIYKINNQQDEHHQHICNEKSSDFCFSSQPFNLS